MFSFSVAHDLHTPLRAIGGYSEILLAQAGPHMEEKHLQMLRRIVERAGRMEALINALLNLARLDRHALKTEPVQLARLAADVFEEKKQELECPEVELRLGDVPDCRGDAILLRQALANLLSNAIKFTRGKAGARVELGAAEEEGETVYFVRDNGAGFDMRYAAKLFIPFQRLHVEEHFKGSGIGLSIVQQVIQRHGGRIWAQAEPNRGATFYFTLAPKGAPVVAR
jgi:signal transduction histidine kinase